MVFLPPLSATVNDLQGKIGRASVRSLPDYFCVVDNQQWTLDIKLWFIANACDGFVSSMARSQYKHKLLCGFCVIFLNPRLYFPRYSLFIIDWAPILICQVNSNTGLDFLPSLILWRDISFLNFLRIFKFLICWNQLTLFYPMKKCIDL